MHLKVTILGSGTSTGVPVIGCECHVCRSSDSRNQRLRSSLLIEDKDTNQIILIDTTPDLRQQALRIKLSQLDHVLFTHTHADHLNGFDDLRGFFFKHKKAIDCWLLDEHIPEMKQRFFYAFQNTGYMGVVPQINIKNLANGTIKIGTLDIEYATLPHGHMNTACFKIGAFCYATDFKFFPDELIARWKGKIKWMVASGLRFRDHPSHSVISETLELFEKLGVEKGVITHLSHEVDYQRDSEKLPPHVCFAYDGMILDLDLP